METGHSALLNGELSIASILFFSLFEGSSLVTNSDLYFNLVIIRKKVIGTAQTTKEQMSKNDMRMSNKAHVHYRSCSALCPDHKCNPKLNWENVWTEDTADLMNDRDASDIQ